MTSNEANPESSDLLGDEGAPTTSGAKTLWPAWAELSKPRDIQPHAALAARFIDRVEQVLPALIMGQPGLDLPAEAHDLALERVLTAARSSGEDKRMARWWDSLIEAGNKAEIWKIGFPTSRPSLPPLQPVFVRQDFQILTPYRTIESAFLDDLSSGRIEALSVPDAALLAAILFGGVVTNARFDALQRSDLTQLQMSDGLLWLPLTVAPGKLQERTDIWFPDAITTALIARMSREQQALWPGAVTASGDPNPKKSDGALALHGALRTLNLPPWPYDATRFLRAAEVSMRLEIPGFTASYLAGEVVSHSLPAPVRARIAHWQCNAPSVDQAESKIRAEGDPRHLDTKFDPTTTTASQVGVLREAARILGSRKTPVKRLTELQTKHAGSLWPITQTLIEWAMWLLNPEGERKAVVVSTAKTYLNLVAGRLLQIVEDDDILDYEPDDFETLYELASERVKSTAQRGRFWGRIRLFHDFLFLCGAPDIDLRELDGYVQEVGTRVSVNLIAEREFREFKQALLSMIETSGSDHLTMILLTGICGYRLGLRRRETQMIHLRDIHPGPHPYLLVRPSRLAALKTHAARRQLPLDVLLLPDELEVLVRFAERRRQQDGDAPGLLFASTDAHNMPLPVDRLFDPVTEMFKAIGGLSAGPFRFHHLRHSFANWILLALMASDDRSLLADKPAFIDSEMLSPAQLQRIRKGLFPRLAGTDDPPGRRHLYQVAALMGHLSPETTLKCYLHLIDWLASRELDLAVGRSLSTWSPSQLGALCGLTHSMCFREPYKSLHERPIAFLRRYARNRMPRQFHVQPAERSPSRNIAAVLEKHSTPVLPSILTSMTVLQRYYDGKSAGWLENAFSIPAKAIEAAGQAYAQMYAKQSSVTSKVSFKAPYEPRRREDRKEFWRIVHACEKSFRDPSNHDLMYKAAEALIRRTGPRVGHIRFGKNLQDAKAIAMGLLLMGLEIKDLSLCLCHPPAGPNITPATNQMAKAIRALGVEFSTETINWEKRKTENSLLRLDIDLVRKGGVFENRRWGSRATALNYSAMWIRMVAAI